MEADIGVIGLAVMGRNLALNLADHGYTVAVYNRTYEKTRAFIESPEAAGKPLIPCQILDDFVAAIKPPRPAILMIKSGPPVDEEIARLRSLFNPGDIIMDGGNSFFEDTRRRCRELDGTGIRYLGVGISGGEEGARNGPAIMPGGDADAYRQVEPILTSIAAVAEGQPCCSYIGPDGAGHYVKMVHNGIEYADMQLIGEAYFLLRHVVGLGYSEMREVFAGWNAGKLSSYLIEITADILGRMDPDSGQPLVELIRDSAGQKGTGAWTTESALSLGVAAPTIAEAVFARTLSAIKDERVAASRLLSGPARTAPADREAVVQAIGDSLYAAKICCYAQGFDLLRQASETYGWNLDYGSLALLWRGGCIIRAVFLSRIKDAFVRDPGLANLMLDPYFTEAVEQGQDGWRRMVGLAAASGVPIPAFYSALAYYDGYRSERLWANLIQAQRDYFGAHTYERLDKPGFFHTDWIK